MLLVVVVAVVAVVVRRGFFSTRLWQFCVFCVLLCVCFQFSFRITSRNTEPGKGHHISCIALLIIHKHIPNPPSPATPRPPPPPATVTARPQPHAAALRRHHLRCCRRCLSPARGPYFVRVAICATRRRSSPATGFWPRPMSSPRS